MKKWHQPAKKPESIADVRQAKPNNATKQRKTDQDDSYLSDEGDEQDNIGQHKVPKSNHQVPSPSKQSKKNFTTATSMQQKPQQ